MDLNNLDKKIDFDLEIKISKKVHIRNIQRNGHRKQTIYIGHVK